MLTSKEQELINFAHFINTHPWLPFIIIPLAIWVIAWKGTALWKAARNGSKPWFIALLIVNTLGILEIFYIFFFSKNKEK